MIICIGKKLICAGVILTVIHFSLNYYVAYQIGSKAGLAITEMITTTMEDSDSVEKQYEKTKTSIKTTIEDWQPIINVVSLPLGPVIDPIEKRIFNKYVYEPVLNKKRHYGEIKTLGYFISYSGSMLNSIAFSGCIIGIRQMFRWLLAGKKE